jgi:DNA-binding response OmpR family regulator
MASFPGPFSRGEVGAYRVDSDLTKGEGLSSSAEPAVRILLVDPAEDSFIHDLLLKFGDARFMVERAASLASGLEHLKTQEVDIVLLDSRLPDGAGLQSLGALRSSFPQTPVILLTEHRDKGWFPKALQLGAKDCVVRGSVDGQLLGRAILRHIKGL